MKKFISWLLTACLIFSLVGIPTVYADFDYDMSEEADNSLAVTYENLDGSEYAWAEHTYHNAYFYEDEESGKTVATISFDSTTYLFDGWYLDGQLVSDKIDFEFDSDSVDLNKLSAKLITRNILVGGSGFEGYDDGVNLRVDPANTGLEAYDDKWGIYNPFNDSAHDIVEGYELKDWSFGVTAATGTQMNEYLDSYWYDDAGKTQRNYKEHKITPFGGDGMLALALPSRSAIRKIEGLKPNTSYTVKFMVYTPDEWDFIKNVAIANTCDIKTGRTTPKNDGEKFYGAYTESYTSVAENSTTSFVIDDKSKVRNWSLVSAQFITGDATNDSGTVDAFMHLSISSKNSSGSKCIIYIDDLTCAEDVISNAGNSIRTTTPQGLRYKFFMNSDNMQSYNGMTAKNVGMLVAPTNYLGGKDLVVNGTYSYNGKEITPQNKTIGENNKQHVEGDEVNTYFTASLFNIGYNKETKVTNYDKYGAYYSVRPYATYNNNGKDIVIYGDTVEASVFDVMNAILQDYRNETDIRATETLLDNEKIYNVYTAWQPKDGWYVGKSTATDYDYSFAVVGDIQKTTGFYPEKLHYTYDWIINNAKSNKIEYVIGLGDVSESDAAKEYATAETEFKRLQAAGIDQTIIRGNHDWNFDSYITLDEYKTNTTVSYDGTMKNTYKLVTIGGIKYMMLVLDLFPTHDELAWAEEVVSAHSDYNVILTTHAYFDHDMSLTQDDDISWGCDAENNNSGQDMYDKLISKHSNIVMVLCGHRYPPDDGPNYRISTREDGSKVMQMMVNPQYMEDSNKKAYGMVAMLYFSNGGKNVSLEYFSTISGLYYMDKFQFSFELDLVD